jgi:DNA-directed RNA polymerase subunit E'/Rpb7
LPLQVKEKSRTVIASEQAILFQQFTKNLKKGDVVEGVVDFCTDYGAFVRLGAGESFRGVEVCCQSPSYQLTSDSDANFESLTDCQQ